MFSPSQTQSQDSWWHSDSDSDSVSSTALTLCPVCRTPSTFTYSHGVAYCSTCNSASQSQSQEISQEDEDAMLLGARIKGNLIGTRRVKVRKGMDQPESLGLPSTDGVLRACTTVLQALVVRVADMLGRGSADCDKLLSMTASTWFKYLSEWREEARVANERGDGGREFDFAYWFFTPQLKGIVNKKASNTHTQRLPIEGTRTGDPTGTTRALQLVPSMPLLLAVVQLSVYRCGGGVCPATLCNWACSGRIPYVTAYECLSKRVRLELGGVVAFFCPRLLVESGQVEKLCRGLSLVVWGDKQGHTPGWQAGLQDPKNRLWCCEQWGQLCNDNVRGCVQRIVEELKLGPEVMGSFLGLLNGLEGEVGDEGINESFGGWEEEFRRLFVDSGQLLAWVVVAWKLAGGLNKEYREEGGGGMMPLSDVERDGVKQGGEWSAVEKGLDMMRSNLADGDTKRLYDVYSKHQVRFGLFRMQEERNVGGKSEQAEKKTAAFLEALGGDEGDKPGYTQGEGGGRGVRIPAPVFAKGVFDEVTLEFKPTGGVRDAGSGPLTKPARFLSMFVVTRERTGKKDRAGKMKTRRRPWKEQAFPEGYMKMVERCSRYARCKEEELQFHVECVDALIARFSRTPEKGKGPRKRKEADHT